MTTVEDASPITVLFDIDGTLVDSNYLHVDAWDRAFVSVGHPVDAWRIHRGIGMDSAMLLDRLLGADADALGERAGNEHSRLYREQSDRLRPVAGARELITTLHERGHRIVLATSAPTDELAVLREVLDIDDAVHAATSADDVATAKPHPDLIHVALDRADTAAGDAIMIGDSVWDIEAAVRAGVRSIGLLSGGFGKDELLTAGAAAIYDDVAELLRELDSSPITQRGQH